MTHTEALATLLGDGSSPRPTTPAAEQVARAHVRACAECRADVAIIARLVSAAAGPNDLAELAACAVIRPQLLFVADVPADRLLDEAPDVAAHVQRCLDCREELLDLQSLPGLEVLDEEPARPPRWLDAVSRAGERVVELAGDFVFGVGRGVVDLVASPLAPRLVPALRGSEEERAHRFDVTLPDGALALQIIVEPGGGDDAAMLSVAVVRGESPITVALRRIEADREALVAAQRSSAGEPFVVRRLSPGRYRLDVGEQGKTVRYRLSIQTEAKR